MKAKTKTKALLMSLCAVLLVAASVLGTMAYLTDSKDVKNTFTVGNVSIKLDEAKVNADGKAIDKEGNVVTDLAKAERVAENSYKLLPGHEYTKDPTVTVNTPSVESYVRMKVTFNKAKEIIAMCGADPDLVDDPYDEDVTNAYPLIYMVNFTEDSDMYWTGTAINSMVETEEMLKDAKYFVYDKTANTLTYYFYYNGTVAAPTENVVLPVLFDSIKVPEWATNDQLKALQGFEINVVAEAIQADGFENADAAWAAFAAQK